MRFVLARPTVTDEPRTSGTTSIRAEPLCTTRYASGGAAIPSDGPLIVAANHPTGALDGLVLIEVIRQVRTDVRLIANSVLARIPELEDSCFFVDPFGGPDAASRSLAGMRGAHIWLRRGGAVIVFPAGEVAWRFGSRTPGARTVDTPRDSPWHASIGRLALATRARVLPITVAALSILTALPWLTSQLITDLWHRADRQHIDIGSAMTAAHQAYAGQRLAAEGPFQTGLHPGQHPATVLTPSPAAPPPALIAVAYACFFVGQALQRRAALALAE